MVERAQSRGESKEIGDSDDIDVSVIGETGDQSGIPLCDLAVEEVTEGGTSVGVIEAEEVNPRSRIEAADLADEAIDSIECRSHRLRRPYKRMPL